MSQTQQQTGSIPRRDSDSDPIQRQACDAERLAAACSSTVRHELRVSSNTLIGMCWLLQRSGLDSLQQGYLGELHAAAKQLLGIVDQLLDGQGADAEGPVMPRQGLLAPSDACTDHLEMPASCCTELADAPVDEAGWRHLSSRLLVLLEDSDTECIELAREHDGLLRAGLGPDYQALTGALSRFDFELALQLLRAAQS